MTSVQNKKIDSRRFPECLQQSWMRRQKTRWNYSGYLLQQNMGVKFNYKTYHFTRSRLWLVPMVDITLKLIWYRLGESFDKMANAGQGITAWLFSDWDDNLLDVLLFGWIGWAVLVVIIVNAVLTFFGPLKPRDSWDQSTRGVPGTIVVEKTGSESCQWLNSALNWFYLHYDKFPEFVDAWVLGLNEQTTKLGVSMLNSWMKEGNPSCIFHRDCLKIQNTSVKYW